VPALRLRRRWLRLTGSDGDDDAAARARREALRLPLWAVLVSCLGWLPGGVLFPLLIDRRAGPVAGEVFARFVVSFTISGLIALTYSFLATQYVVLRVLYPSLWSEADDPRARA